MFRTSFTEGSTLICWLSYSLLKILGFTLTSIVPYSHSRTFRLFQFFFYFNVIVWTSIRLQSTALRPLDDLRYDSRPTCCGLLYCGLNKGNRSAWPRLAGYVTVTLMNEWPLISRRTAVESKSNRNCNHRITATTWCQVFQIMSTGRKLLTAAVYVFLCL